MKKQLSYVSVAILSLGLFVASCKKESSTATDSPDSAAQLQVQSDDQERFSAETDEVANDANAALENSATSIGETPQGPTLGKRCDVEVAIDTLSNPRTITLTYNGNCLGNRTRTGSVLMSFQPGFRWSTPGSTYSVTYINLKITRKRDGKSITINGTKTITNVNGGKLRNLATATSPVVHEIKSNGMSITFDDGTQRTWKLAKRRTYTYANGIVLSIEGISSEGAGVSEWGTNRFGKSFTVSILQPLVIKQSCDFRLVSGQIKHSGEVKTSTTTFGLNPGGTPVTDCPAALYFKVEWTGADGTTKTFIAPY